MRRRRSRERGLSTVEYVLILVLVGAVSLAAWKVFGQQIQCALEKAQAAFSEGLELPASGTSSHCPRSGSGSTGGGAGSPGSGGPSGPGTGSGAAGSSGSGAAGSGAAGPGGTPGPSPADDAAWIQNMRSVMCPGDKAFLQKMKADGVTITAYDRIYYEDPYFDGTQWTTRTFEGGGSTNGTDIAIIRSGNSTDDGSTIFHEGVHTQQPGSMAWRDMEYDAYAREDQWRMSRGLPPHDPSFRGTDAAGNPVTDAAAVRAYVDREYPGVSVTPPGGGPPEQVVDRTPGGDTIVERADGTRYTRPPQAGDSFAGDQQTVPDGGVSINIDDLQCP